MVLEVPVTIRLFYQAIIFRAFSLAQKRCWAIAAIKVFSIAVRPGLITITKLLAIQLKLNELIAAHDPETKEVVIQEKNCYYQLSLYRICRSFAPNLSNVPTLSRLDQNNSSERNIHRSSRPGLSN